MTKKVIIILPNSLETMGIKLLLQENFSAQVATATTLTQTTVNDREKCDLLVTHEGEFLSNLAFFMPCKDKTVLVADREIAGFNCILRSNTPDEIAAQLSNFFKDNTDDQANRLSPREISVLQLVVEGCINKEIADRLNISVNTVLTHRKNITAKLGIKSVSGLSVYALMNGLVKQ